MDAGGSRGIKPKGEEPGSGLPSGRCRYYAYVAGTGDREDDG